MKRLLIATAVVLGAAALVTPVLAQTPEPPAWPGRHDAGVRLGPHADGGQLATRPRGREAGELLPPRLGGRFQVYAVDLKTNKVVTAKDAKYFYVSIPTSRT